MPAVLNSTLMYLEVNQNQLKLAFTTNPVSTNRILPSSVLQILLRHNSKIQVYCHHNRGDCSVRQQVLYVDSKCRQWKNTGGQ